jgi:hypothetical protein
MRVPEILSHWQEKIDLGAPVPHFDYADLNRRSAEKGRVGLNGFEIAADRHALRDCGSIVQDQNWHALDGIELGKVPGLVRSAHDVDLLEGNMNPFLSQEDPHPARIWRPPFVQDFHR